MCDRHRPLNGADSYDAADHGMVTLTRQQARALGAVALNGDRDTAALALGVSPLTLRNHLDLAFGRLGVGSITAALGAAGWLDVPAELLDLEAVDLRPAVLVLDV